MRTQRRQRMAELLRFGEQLVKPGLNVTPKLVKHRATDPSVRG
jgi:hypothetical protein